MMLITLDLSTDDHKYTKKVNKDKTKNTEGPVDKENRRIGRRMFKNTESSIPRLSELKDTEDSFMTSKPGKKRNPMGTHQIFGSQIVIQ